MKLLLLFAHDYWLKPFGQSLETAAPLPKPVTAVEAVVALIHVEPQDIERHAKLVTRVTKQLKWLARKFTSRTIVLHSFAHLATSSAQPTAAERLLADVAQRLRSAEYTVHMSPFGYFNEFKLHVAGPSLAKVFVDL